jgi:hypothetical protein
MADVKMPQSVPCQFDEGGWAPCRKPSTNGWCSKHEGMKCLSCGTQAYQSCDAQMGGLACGAALCKSCRHSLNDSSHVSSGVLNAQIREREETRKTGKESDRVLTERGVPAGLPKNLKVLLKENRSEYELKRCYALEIRHGLMGYYPAVVKGTKMVIIVSNPELIFRIWKSLEPRDSELTVFEGMTREDIGVVYAMRAKDYEQEESRPHKLFSYSEVEELFKKSPEPFNWAPGLFGASINHRRFNEIIREAAKQHEVTQTA